MSRRDHDFDRAYTRPAGWRKLKDALSSGPEWDSMWACFETASAGYGPREFFVAMVQWWIRADRETHRRAIAEYHNRHDVAAGKKPRTDPQDALIKMMLPEPGMYGQQEYHPDRQRTPDEEFARAMEKCGFPRNAA